MVSKVLPGLFLRMLQTIGSDSQFDFGSIDAFDKFLEEIACLHPLAGLVRMITSPHGWFVRGDGYELASFYNTDVEAIDDRGLCFDDEGLLILVEIEGATYHYRPWEIMNAISGMEHEYGAPAGF